MSLNTTCATFHPRVSLYLRRHSALCAPREGFFYGLLKDINLLALIENLRGAGGVRHRLQGLRVKRVKFRTKLSESDGLVVSPELVHIRVRDLPEIRDDTLAVLQIHRTLQRIVDLIMELHPLTRKLLSARGVHHYGCVDRVISQSELSLHPSLNIKVPTQLYRMGR
jgi:hypothetical protein